MGWSSFAAHNGWLGSKHQLIKIVLHAFFFFFNVQVMPCQRRPCVWSILVSVFATWQRTIQAQVLDTKISSLNESAHVRAVDTKIYSRSVYEADLELLSVCSTAHPTFPPVKLHVTCACVWASWEREKERVCANEAPMVWFSTFCYVYFGGM